MSDWSPEREELANIRDILGSIFQAILATGRVKPPSVPRAARPHTAFDRARTRRRMDRHFALVAKVIRQKPSL